MSSQARELDTHAAEVEAAALDLPRVERAQLAARLLASLDEETAVERAWEEEITRRVEDLRLGRVKTRPVEELLDEIEARIQ